MSHWVQIEMPTQGKLTSAIQLDLEKINRVSIVRSDKTPQQVRIGYEYAEVILGDDETQGSDTTVASFLEQWNQFAELKHVDAEAEPGQIHVAVPRGSGKSNIIKP